MKYKVKNIGENLSTDELDLALENFLNVSGKEGWTLWDIKTIYGSTGYTNRLMVVLHRTQEINPLKRRTRKV